MKIDPMANFDSAHSFVDQFSHFIETLLYKFLETEIFEKSFVILDDLLQKWPSLMDTKTPIPA